MPWPVMASTAPDAGSDTSVEGLAFSADGGRLAYGSSDGAVRIVDTTSGRVEREWPGRHDDQIRLITAHPASPTQRRVYLRGRA